MFSFNIEPEVPLLTVTQTGMWTNATVSDFEPAYREQLSLLQIHGRPTALIVDIRATATRDYDVTEALRCLVARLGNLQADKTAIVSSLGFAQLRAGHTPDKNARIFTSLDRARSWLINSSHPELSSRPVSEEPSDVTAEGLVVCVQGPWDVDFVLTPAAALETAKRLSDAAIEVILGNASKAGTCPPFPGRR